jgi:hypothetical protein
MLSTLYQDDRTTTSAAKEACTHQATIRYVKATETAERATKWIADHREVCHG